MSQTQVQSGFIGDNSVTATQIAAGAITSAKIADGNVTTAKIADANVTTAKIADANVTTAKLNSIVSASLVPTGAVFHFAASTAPVGYLKANGDTIPNGTGTVQGITTNFSTLYAILGSTYGAAGKLPDLRGEFIRGWDDSRGVDTGRTIGSWQKGTLVAGYDDNDSNSDISFLPGRAFRDYGSDPINASIASTEYGMSIVRWLQTTPNVDYDLSTVSSWTSITRPRNVALLACIKY